jgi:hypothetical protein
VKRAWVWFTIAGSLGLLTAVTLTVNEGVKYRIREEQGLDPIWAPTWLAATTYVGLAIFVVSAVVLLAIALTPPQKPAETTPR